MNEVEARTEHIDSRLQASRCSDELGSGVRKPFRYSILYIGRKPELVEGDIFKVFVPLCEADINKRLLQATPQATPHVERLSNFVGNQDVEKKCRFLSLKERKYFLNGDIKCSDHERCVIDDYSR